MNKFKILFVEDDKNMGFLLKENLVMEGFEVSLSKDGESALKAYEKSKFDLLILDIMLPKKDGLSLAKEIRRKNKKVPIIFLTARSMRSDKIVGFQVGCDDYITKPFDEEELGYRIKAIMKRVGSRYHEDNLDDIVIGNIIINVRERVIKYKDDEIKISAKEAALINILSKNQNSVVSRNRILKEIWDRDDYFTSKSLDVYLSKIRKYFSLDSNIKLENIHGYGYKLKF